MKKAKLVGEIQELAFLISSISNHHIFTDYQAHVSKINVRIYIDGWKKVKIENCKKGCEIDFYLDKANSLQILTKTKEILEHILKNCYQPVLKEEDAPVVAEASELKRVGEVGC